MIKILITLIVVFTAVIVVMLAYFKSRPQPSPVDSDFSSFTSADESESQEGTDTTTLAAIENRVSQSTTAETTQKQTTVLQSTTAAVTISQETNRIVVDPEKGIWNLVVVNAGREYVSTYEPKLAEILDTGKYLDYRVAPYYEKMYLAAKKDGIILTPYSSYRTYERQKINYENLTNEYMARYGISKAEAAKKAATVILPPGTSEHNLGLAVDVCNTYDSFANSKEYAWLCENAAEYGFILRYTAEKQHITGIVPEPWHWRFVGTEYAQKIKDSGLCLEEWLDSMGIDY